LKDQMDRGGALWRRREGKANSVDQGSKKLLGHMEGRI